MQLKKEYIDNNTSIVVIGNTSSGKTNAAFYFANQCSHKDKYTLGYPAKIEGYKQLWDANDLFKLKDCVVIIDEFQRYFKRFGRHHNDALEEALDFAEHRNVKLILTAQNNQAIDRNLESKMKIWVLKKLNIFTLKQGGMCKVAMRSIKHPLITSAGLSFEVNQYLWYNISANAGENGLYTFPDQKIGKDWCNTDKKSLKKAEKMSKKSKEE